MRTSRTRPTKLATAPTFGSREIARTSAESSKSSFCTLTFMVPASAAGHRREERDLVARLDARARLHHVPVHRRAHVAARREHGGPRAAPAAQVLAQGADGRDARRQLDLLAARAELLAQRGKEKEL